MKGRNNMNIKELIKNNKFMCTSNNDYYMEITELKDNKMSICPQGGGFVKSIDINNQSFIDDVVSKKIKFTNDMPMIWKKVKLYHDHWLSDETVEVNGRVKIEHYIEGYVTNHKWNGWSIPMVQLDQIVKFNEIQEKTLDSEPSSIFKIIVKDSIICIKMFDEDEWVTIESSEINVDGKKLKVFDISLGWTWSEEEINPKKG
tara:strand:- start:23 stop:628 length:606 start_codon:yes stop_codon:yes gene_type:complete